LRKLFFILFVGFSFGQKLDPIDIAIDEMRTVLETASRSSQKVFVEDFTGLL